MSKRILLLSVAACGLTVGALAGWVVAWSVAPNYWKPIPFASVLVDGKKLGQARLYRNAYGSLLVYPEPSRGDLYVVRASTVGLTSPHYFWVVSRWGAVSKDYPDPSIDMAGPKVERPPELTFANNEISFRSISGGRVQLSRFW